MNFLSGFGIFISIFFYRFFLDIMAYTGTSSAYRTIISGGSRGSIPKQEHIYEEQPYYANERPITRQSIGGDNRRSVGVCSLLIKKIINDRSQS
jgi:hypothetical protein